MGAISRIKTSSRLQFRLGFWLLFATLSFWSLLGSLGWAWVSKNEDSHHLDGVIEVYYLRESYIAILLGLLAITLALIAQVFGLLVVVNVLQKARHGIRDSNE